MVTKSKFAVPQFGQVTMLEGGLLSGDSKDGRPAGGMELARLAPSNAGGGVTVDVRAAGSCALLGRGGPANGTSGGAYDAGSGGAGGGGGAGFAAPKTR
ncbi:MAG TPA: hypothetical protein VE258_01105, partial [Ktedonobacterales bacterium]|nr:hypothetical protein [Ktedonobacterales bacterium]